jgi:hypothetical protein
MIAMPDKVARRIAAGLRKFQPILAASRSRRPSEADAYALTEDLLAEVFGYDKYTQISCECMDGGACRDLAVTLNGAIAMLIEVKAAGQALTEPFLEHALEHAVSEGCEWLVLTNASLWRVYKLSFSETVEHERVLEFDLEHLHPRSEADLALAFTLTREGWNAGRLAEIHAQRQALGRYALAALVLTEPVLGAIHDALRRIAPRLSVRNDEIALLLREQVVRPELLEGSRAQAAHELVHRKRVRTHRVGDVAVAAAIPLELPPAPRPILGPLEGYPYAESAGDICS